MKNKKLEKKILLDLRLFIILVPLFVAGFLSAPFVQNKFFDISPILSGICAAPALVIILYLVISWMFYDYFYED